jgi:hypothetical protein
MNYFKYTPFFSHCKRTSDTFLDYRLKVEATSLYSSLSLIADLKPSLILSSNGVIHTKVYCVAR